MMDIPNIFSKSLLNLFGVRTPKNIALSISGGVDSMALASLTSSWAKYRGVQVKAFIVDHQLRKESTYEAKKVSEYLESTFDMPTSILTLNGVDKDSSRLEELARNGRRSLLADACRKEGFQHLMLGHHLDDQLELFVLRSLAGSSWFGLAGMLPNTAMNMMFHKGNEPVRILRPFSDVHKKQLIEWCTNQNIKWWEDPTNQDVSLTERNLIRNWFKTSYSASEYHFEELISLFGRRRREILEIADTALRQLQLNKRYQTEWPSQTAQLHINQDLRSLPSGVVTEILYRIVAPLSPKPEDVVARKRTSLSGIANELHNGNKHVSTNVSGVLIEGDNEKWTFRREPSRKTEMMRVEIYKATNTWSDFTLIDNRWYLRWRLITKDSARDGHVLHKSEKDSAPKSRYFNISFVNDPIKVFKPLSSEINSVAKKRIRNNVSSHPFFLWSDPLDPFTITSKKTIGFPTLGIFVSDELEVEVLPKLCAF